MAIRAMLLSLIALATAFGSVSAEEARTGFFRVSTTPLELLGEQGAEAIQSVFASDQTLSWQLTVADNYDPQKPAGVIVMLNPHDGGAGKRDWQKELAARNLIIIGAIDAGDDTPLGERMLKAILAQALLMRDYKIDPERYYVAGYAGGAHVAAILATSRPETFKGAIYFSGARSWEGRVPPKIELVRRNRFVFVAGANDPTKTTVRRVAKDYAEAGVTATKLFIVPNMRRSLPDPGYLARALEFLESGQTHLKDDG